MHARGFIALISVMVVSAMLLGLLLISSTAGFFSRTDMLDGEYAANSAGLAEGCVDSALLHVSEDYAFERVASPLIVGGQTCQSVSVDTLASETAQKTVRIDVLASYRHAFRHMQVLATVQNPAVSTSSDPLISIVSWQVMP